jgi:hypothetical protein
MTGGEVRRVPRPRSPAHRRSRNVKTYIVYVDGREVGYIKAGSHNAAEAKAQKKYPGRHVMVEYTEL